MTRPSWVPAEVDLSRPSAARVYDYYLGGSHNLEVDRRMAREAISLWPDLPEIMQACDVGIVCYSSNGLNNVYCASNKIFEYAQAGLPVVSTCQPPLRSLVERYGTGVLVGCAGAAPTPGEIAAAVMQLSASPERFRAGIAELLSEHTWEHEAHGLRAVVQRVVSEA